jgi:hypothetical protein
LVSSSTNALNSRFAKSQILSRLIERQMQPAIVAAVVAGVQFQPDFDSCPRKGPPCF